MNDNDKFKKFFGFGGEEQAQENNETTTEHNSEKDVLEKAHQTITEWSDKYLSLTADFQNYKKRVSQERADWAQDAQKLVILDLLNIIDNFERALDQERKRENSEDTSWLKGFEMIYQSLEKTLAKYDVHAIANTTDFDPKFHEALVQVESANHNSGDIVQVLQKGYMMHDKVIRPATVSVAK